MRFRRFNYKLFLFIILLLYSLMGLGSDFKKFNKDSTVEDLLGSYYPVSESVVIGDVVAITTMVNRLDNTTADGFLVENYTVSNLEPMIGETESLGQVIDVISYGGEGFLPNAASIEPNPKKYKFIQQYYRFSDSFSNWPKILEHGKYLIFIETRRRERSMVDVGRLHLAKAYRVQKGDGREFIEVPIISGGISSEEDKTKKFFMDEIINNIMMNESVLDTYNYTTVIKEGAIYAE